MISDVPLLSCTGLSRFYPPATWALREANLNLYPGQSVAISGASGSGKSTLLGLLGLLDSPTQGSIKISGQELAQADDSERTRIRSEYIAFVFQAFHLVQHLTAQENISYALENRGVKRNEARHRAQKALEAVGLNHRLNHCPSNLSGGEQQRVGVARALACKAPLILCDEPTGNLDTENSHRVLDLLLEYRESALVIITHEPDIAERCDRHLIMVDGCLMEKGG
ncbi:ABC transporter ATP-binding protein [Rothia nasimurium]